MSIFVEFLSNIDEWQCRDKRERDIEIQSSEFDFIPLLLAAAGQETRKKTCSSAWLIDWLINNIIRCVGVLNLSGNYLSPFYYTLLSRS